MTSRQLRRRKVLIGILLVVLLGVAFCLGDFETTVLLCSAAGGLALGCGLSMFSYVKNDGILAKCDAAAARNSVVTGILGCILGSSVEMSTWPWHMRTNDTMAPQMICGFAVTLIYFAWPRRVEPTKQEPQE